jgi:leucyl-tRNA synthetase
MDWSAQTDQVIDGCGRFLDRLWRTCTSEPLRRAGALTAEDRAVRRSVHRTIQDVSRDLERWSYNTAVAHCMELLNEVQRYGRAVEGSAPADGPGDAGHLADRRVSVDGPAGAHEEVWNEALDTLLLLLAVMAPHVTAELWEWRHPGQPSVHLQPWPAFDPELVRQDTLTMVVQVNGKVRDRLEVAAGISEADAEALVLASPKVLEALAGRVPVRVVARPPRLVNVVV